MSIHNGDRSVGSVAIVVAAAGMGTRFGGQLPKALEPIAGRPLLAYSLATIASLSAQVEVDAVIVTSPAGHEAEVAAVCQTFSPLPIRVVTGGRERSDSIALALREVPARTGIVLVHDAARAFTPLSLFQDVVAAVRAGADAVVPGLPVADTIRRIDGERSETVDRTSLRRVQTPQGFHRAKLDEAYSRLGTQPVTDDASVMELLGIPVEVVPGADEAFKVTTPIDRALAEAIVESRSAQ